MNKPPTGYPLLLSDIKNKSRQAQYEAMKAVSTQLVQLYWEIGKSITEKQADGWGKSIVESLARDLQMEFPGMRGISTTNLWLMAQFYNEYHKVEFLQSLIGEISWTHHTIILSKCKDNRERPFYIGATRKFGVTTYRLTPELPENLRKFLPDSGTIAQRVKDFVFQYTADSQTDFSSKK